MLEPKIITLRAMYYHRTKFSKHRDLMLCDQLSLIYMNIINIWYWFIFHF